MDPEGFDPEADTVGAGIYSGNIKVDDYGNPLIAAPQYQGHNPLPGPVYDGTGYTKLSRAIQSGDLDTIKSMCKADPNAANQLTTGGAWPLHTCGMSKRGQMATQT